MFYFKDLASVSKPLVKKFSIPYLEPVGILIATGLAIEIECFSSYDVKCQVEERTYVNQTPHHIVRLNNRQDMK